MRWTYAAVLNIIYTKENDADCVHPIRGNVTHRADVTHWVDAISAFEQQFEYALENYFAPQNGR